MQERYGTTRPPKWQPETPFCGLSWPENTKNCDFRRFLSIFHVFDTTLHAVVLWVGAVLVFMLPRDTREPVAGRWRWWLPSIGLCAGAESARQQVNRTFFNPYGAKNKKQHKSGNRKTITFWFFLVVFPVV